MIGSLLRFAPPWGLVLTVLLLCPAAAPQETPQETPPEPWELLERIEKQGDAVQPRVFVELARIGTRDAFKASRKAVEHLRNENRLNRAYAAFVHYGTVDELRPLALDFLRDETLSHRRAPNRRAAARGLVAYGELGEEALEKILARHKDAAVRGIAVAALLDVLAERNDAASARLILENAELRADPDYGAVRQALNRFDSEEALGVMLAKLSDESTGRRWRELLLERLSREPSPAISAEMVSLLSSEDLVLRQRAIELLGEQREKSAERALWKLLKSKDDPTLHATVVALGRILVAEEPWQKRLLTLSADRRWAVRMGAAVALAELRTPEAIERLYALLADAERTVRIEAVQQVGNLRRLDSIPVLIERLAAEKSRLKGDVATVLRLITGLDHGSTRRRWKAWWDDQGADFRLPSYEEARIAEEERRLRREDNASIATFYGLNVVSDRVCFILDVSGSMSSPARGKSGRTSSREGGGSTRIAVAQNELSNALRAYPAGQHFNMIFFEGGVRPWKGRLQEMDESLRAEALAHVARQGPGGGTAVYDALAKAFEDELVDTLYLLTDGDPSAGKYVNASRIRQEIARLNTVRKVQIHCISVGQSSALLRGLAEDSGGQYREVL